MVNRCALLASRHALVHFPESDLVILSKIRVIRVICDIKSLILLFPGAKNPQQHNKQVNEIQIQ